MSMRGAPVLAALVLCSACTGPLDLTQPVATPSGVATTTAETASPDPTSPASPQRPPATQDTRQTELPPTTAVPAPAPGTTEAVPPRGQQLQLSPGQTAGLTYFDVTFQRFAHGQDGVSAGWRVETCYRRQHPGQTPDNTTRVSSDPWSVLVLDAEGPDGRPVWVAINEFPRDNEWSPPYPTTQLKLGRCQTGWLGVRHGNPDLQFLAVRYAPADFGDVVTWNTEG